MATPGGAAPLAALMPARRYIDLPAEIYANVVSYLTNNRAALEALISAGGPSTYEALRLYWRTATPENDLLALLESKQPIHRQFYADLLHSVTIVFKAPGDPHEGRGLQYPRLQSLTVIHDQVLMGIESITFARIKRFISPCLRELEVGGQLHESPDVKPTTDNFLPALSGCMSLRSLALRARVRTATPEDLTRVISNCSRLNTLHLEKYTDRLIDETTINAIARHPAISHLQVDHHLNDHLVSLIGGIPDPFQHVASLTLCIDASAAPSVLPHMKALEFLELTVFSDYGAPSIFSSLSTLTTLKTIYLKFNNYILKDDDLTHLVPLKGLEMLELSDNDEVALNTSLIRPEFFAAVLGSLPMLNSCTLHATHTFGDSFLIALGRNCVALQTLTLDGPFNLEPLSSKQGTLFPRLSVLELGRVESTLPLRSWGGFREAWAGEIARSLLRHAPQLEQLRLSENGDGGLGQLVEETWEEMIEERDG